MIFNPSPTLGVPPYTDLTSPSGPYSRTFLAGGNPSPKRIKVGYFMQLFAELGDGALQFLNATNFAAAQTATLTNAPVAGNPTFWLKIAINNAFKIIPAW